MSAVRSEKKEDSQCIGITRHNEKNKAAMS